MKSVHNLGMMHVSYNVLVVHEARSCKIIRLRFRLNVVLTLVSFVDLCWH
jgi:hypothetical protein